MKTQMLVGFVGGLILLGLGVGCSSAETDDVGMGGDAVKAPDDPTRVFPNILREHVLIGDDGREGTLTFDKVKSGETITDSLKFSLHVLQKSGNYRADHFPRR